MRRYPMPLWEKFPTGCGQCSANTGKPRRKDHAKEAGESACPTSAQAFSTVGQAFSPVSFSLTAQHYADSIRFHIQVIDMMRQLKRLSHLRIWKLRNQEVVNQVI